MSEGGQMSHRGRRGLRVLTLVSLVASASLSSVTIASPAHAAGFALQGHVTEDGAVLSPGTVELLQAGTSTVVRSTSLSFATSDDGSYHFDSVPGGTYDLRVTPGSNNLTPAAVDPGVVVQTDTIHDVAVPLGSRVHAHNKLQLADGAPLPLPSSASTVIGYSAGGDPGYATGSAADGTFDFFTNASSGGQFMVSSPMLHDIYGVDSFSPNIFSNFGGGVAISTLSALTIPFSRTQARLLDSTGAPLSGWTVRVTQTTSDPIANPYGAWYRSSSDVSEDATGSDGVAHVLAFTNQGATVEVVSPGGSHQTGTYKFQPGGTLTIRLDASGALVPPAPTSLSIVSPVNSFNAMLGTPLELQLEAFYDDGPDRRVSNGTAATGDATWTSSAPGVATVGSSTGVVTPVAAGSSTITASFQGRSISQTVVISPPAQLTVSATFDGHTENSSFALLDPSSLSVVWGQIRSGTSATLTVPYGTYVLQASPSANDAARLQRSQITLTGDQSVVVEYSTAGLIRTTGTVQLDDGTRVLPTGSGTVGYASNLGRGSLDATGAFSFLAFSGPVRQQLSVRTASLGPDLVDLSSVSTTAAAEEGTTLLVSLPLVRQRVHVVDAAGQPLPDARIFSGDIDGTGAGSWGTCASALTGRTYRLSFGTSSDIVDSNGYGWAIAPSCSLGQPFTLLVTGSVSVAPVRASYVVTPDLTITIRLDSSNVVQPALAQSASIVPSSGAQLEVGGESSQLRSQVTMSDGSVLDNPAGVWSSSAPEVASVVDGLVTPHRSGDAQISYRYPATGSPSVSAMAAVSVVPGVGEMVPATLTIPVGADSHLAVTGQLIEGQTTDDIGADLSWSSSAPAVATVINGAVHGVATGTVTITASNGRSSVTAMVTVQRRTPVVSWATPASISYGAAIGAAQLNAASDVPGTFTYSPSSGAVLHAGDRTLSVTFVPADTTTYTSVTTTVVLRVTPAQLTVTAPDATAVFGSSARQLVAGYAGFVNGEGPSALSSTPTCSDGMSPSRAVGVYSGATACSGGSSNDYALSFVAGRLTVTKAAPRLEQTSVSIVSSVLSASINVSARLTDAAGAGVSGQSLDFYVGATRVCSAKTSSGGGAACSASSMELVHLLLTGYTRVVFAGSTNYLSADVRTSLSL